MTIRFKSIETFVLGLPASAALGIVAGASLGLDVGWLGVQLALTGSMLSVLDTRLQASRASARMGIFVALFMLSGHLGAVLGAPPEVGGWPVAIDLVAAAVQGGIAFGLTYLACAAGLRRSVLMLGALPVLWVFREWLSQEADWGIPWLLVGYAQAPSGPLSALFPIGGVFFVSWACTASAAAIALAWRQPGAVRRGIAIAGAMSLACLAVGLRSQSWTTPVATIQVDMLQSGIASHAKSDTTQQLALLKSIARVVDSSAADVLVSSQLAIPKSMDALPAGYLGALDETLRSRNADAVLGLYVTAGSSPQMYNAALSLGAAGPQLYLKHRLFPFGEYLPLGPLSGPVRRLLDRPIADMLAGPPDQPPLRVGGLRAALAICYEASFGGELRRRSQGANLLINMASDSALDSRQLARQFRQIDRARVLELQKPLLRTSDIRGTFMLNERAETVAEQVDDAPGKLSVAVTGRSGLTPYARWGDAPVLFIGLMSLLACAMGRPGALQACAQRTEPQAPPWAPGAKMQRSGPAPRGQVLPIFVVLLAIAMAFFYFTINATQAVTEKTRLTDAADAAAYSAGVVEARALNFDAYMNRAIIANQLAIAQMVSLASWIDYFASGADNAPRTAADVAFFMFPNLEAMVLEAEFAGTEAASLYFGERPAREFAKYLEAALGVLVTVQDVVSTSLAITQELVRFNLTLAYAQSEMATKVVKDIDPAMEASVILPTHGFDLFTKTYSGGERERMRKTIEESRPLSTRERNYTICSFSIPFFRQDPCEKKRGGTEIRLDNIVAMDTLELHGRRFGCGRWGLSWCNDIREPLAWGAVNVGARDSRTGYHGGARVDNPTTAGRADASMHTPDLAYYSGIPSVLDLRDLGEGNDATSGITVRVGKRHADMLTSGGAAKAKPSGRLQLFDAQPVGGEMVALSRAQVFFDRIAPRADGKAELASLYNPYWRVRLVQPLEADKIYVGIEQGAALP